jgi:imidazolonepropionase-like amidohydrolase
MPLASATPPKFTWTEQSSEVTPHRLLIDSVNLFSNDFARLLRGGVTTVYVSADSANVIGGRGAILKTGGPLTERLVKRADAVKATMGSDPRDRGLPNFLPPYYGPPPSILTRRPTTRMGVEWVFRKAFYDAQRVRDSREIYGADMPPRQAIPVLLQILAGELPLRIQARMQHDIFTALRLAAEFNLKFTLEEATEAYRCLPQLKAAGVPVIFGPLYMTPKGFRGLTDEVNRPRLNTPKQLADAGIEFALTAQELRDEEGLVRQAMLAVQNGLPPAQALQAVTATPARLLDLAGQVGVVAPGAAADLVVWSSEPLDATSRPLVVLINGRVVLEEGN